MFWKSIDQLANQIQQLNSKIDTHSKDTDRRLDNIEKVLIIQEQNLKDHMKRSDHLEEIVQQMKDQDISQLRRHVNMVEGALKFIGLLGVLVSIVGGVFKIIGVI